jgi:hypothetical protein
MNKTTKSESKLSLKKETLQHLKVRTDLKGGLVFSQYLAAACTSSCPTACCSRAASFAQVINPVSFR